MPSVSCSTRPDARSTMNRCSRRLSLNRVNPSAASGLYRYRVITIGSPVASAVSGPGVEETDAIRLPSGAHAIVCPDPGSGAFVPLISATKRADDPSGLATTRPLFSPTRPRYAIHWLSGDHCGLPEL